MKTTYKNYMICTKGTFKACKKPSRKANYISINKFNNKVSSIYWEGKDKYGEYIIRSSNHWSNYIYPYGKNKKIIKKGCAKIRSCWWNLKIEKDKIKNITTGKAYLKNLKCL